MHSPSVFCTAILASTVAGEIFKFPLADGFPNVGPKLMQQIEYIAGGPLPAPAAGGEGSNLSPTAAASLQALAFNEIFEVAFFSQLLNNITCAKPGFELGDDSEQIIAALNSSRAQEELHYLNANLGLKASGYTQIQPCEYNFFVSNFSEAMKIANDFTGLLIGAVPSVITDFKAGPDIVTLFSSILGQEGEQDGYFRWLRKEVPNQNPFLVATTLNFLFNNINQHYVVPKSCPQNLNISIYDELWVTESPPPENTTITFYTTHPNVTTENSITYMSGQDHPVTVAISGIASSGNATKFQASFPYAGGFSRGLTVASLTKTQGQFQSLKDVADATLAGPGLIQVNYN